MLLNLPESTNPEGEQDLEIYYSYQFGLGLLINCLHTKAPS